MSDGRPNNDIIRLVRNEDVSIVCHPRCLHRYHVTESELNNIGSVSRSAAIEMTLFGVSASTAIGDLLALLTVTITSPVVFGALVGLLFISLLTSILFGVRMRIAYQQVMTAINAIKRRE